jgi:hypothetical protein
MIAVTMPPIPILLLFVFVKVLVVAVRIPVAFQDPLLVIDILVAIPAMIVAVVGIIDPVGAPSSHNGRGESASQKYQTKPSSSAAHVISSLAIEHRYREFVAKHRCGVAINY